MKIFISVVKFSHVPIIFSGMKEVREQRKPLNIPSVVKPLLYMFAVMLRGKKGVI